MASRTIVWAGRDRVQIARWKTAPTTANLVPFPAGDKLRLDSIYKTLDEAQRCGFTSAYTSALTPSQAEPFLAVGFTLFEELYLLRRTITSEITIERGRTRRARRTDWPDVLALDHLAFEDFWRFDRTNLVDAIRATPRHRFQVIKTSPPDGYHVTGLAGMNSYLQRVAVHPRAQGRGHGSALVNDSLRWAWRNGATLAQVNTQINNDRAVALYQRCGFTMAPHRLLVLRSDFGTPAPR